MTLCGSIASIRPIQRPKGAFLTLTICQYCQLCHSRKAEDKKETIYEIADLAYHVMVLMIQAGISLEDIHDELASRHVVDHKVKQEKMTN